MDSKLDSKLESKLLNVPGPDNIQFSIRVYQAGSGPDLLFLHGAGGLLKDDPFVQALSRQFRVSAPLLPGFEDSQGEEHLRDMLDFTLHAYDVWQALELSNPVVVGHSMGGMIAAEMAAVAPHAISQLVLLCPAGLWLDEHPIADLFTCLPYELPELLFHDAQLHGGLLSAGGDLDDPEYLTEFMVANARRLGCASKLLFPVPDRGLNQRLYRITATTQILWGASDNLIPPVYLQEFARLMPAAKTAEIAAAGHMLPYEQTEAVLEHIAAALS